MLQLKFQNVKTKEKPYIRLTQGNLIEFQVQSVYKVDTCPCYIDLAYSKETCILYTIDI